MKQAQNFSLQSLNTFQIPAIADQYVRFDTPQEITDYLKQSRLQGHTYLILGGGSNLLFVDDFHGLVLHPQLRGIQVVAETSDQVWVRAMAGENWDDLVAYTVLEGWGGLENLSLIPGNVGASVVQNIGAYGVEVSTVTDRIEAIAVEDGRTVTLDPRDCRFGYRMSRFKQEWKDRFIITAVVFRLNRKPRLVVDYPGVQAAVEKIGPPSIENLRRAIIDLRKSKLPDPAETGNAGSFFKNPIVKQEQLKALKKIYPNLPCYPQGKGTYKVAAGWLIDQCGWKGKSLGGAGVHPHQALVLINRGTATGRDIYDLSEQIRESVFETFGITLEQEVIVLG